MTDIKIYLIVGISLTLLVGAWIFALKQEISFLKEENATLNRDYTQSLANLQTLKSAVDTQNFRIKQHEINISQKENELEFWKSQPEKVKYKNIEKIIEKESSNECEDIKNLLDDIRNTGF